MVCLLRGNQKVTVNNLGGPGLSKNFWIQIVPMLLLDKKRGGLVEKIGNPKSTTLFDTYVADLYPHHTLPHVTPHPTPGSGTSPRLAGVDYVCCCFFQI